MTSDTINGLIAGYGTISLIILMGVLAYNSESYKTVSFVHAAFYILLWPLILISLILAGICYWPFFTFKIIKKSCTLANK